MTEDLRGLRALIVEDEWLAAVHLENILLDAGCEIVGLIGTVAAALRRVERGGFDVAVLDVNLKGEIVWPVADILIDQGMPVVLVTGYEREELEPRYQRLPYCHKPCEAQHVHAAIREAMAGVLRTGFPPGS